jgi:hypothetical protein
VQPPKSGIKKRPSQILQSSAHFGESLFVVFDEWDRWDDNGIPGRPPMREPSAIDLDIGMMRPLM